MPSSRQTLLARRGDAYSGMASILDTAEEAGRELTPDERSRFDRLQQTFDAIGDALGDTDERSGMVLPPQADVRTSDAMAAPFAEWLRGDINDVELRAQGVGTGSAGGYLVPQGFRGKIVETMKAIGSVQSVAEVIETDQGNVLPWPTNDDTSNVGAILSENTQAAEQDLTMGTAQLGAYTYTSKMVRVSLQLLEDSGFPIEPWLSRKLGQRIARAQNPHFTTGTGSSQPQGIVTGATSGVTAAGTTAVTTDELIDLQLSVDEEYLEEPTGFVGWMMAKATWGKIRKLKDSDGRYLVEPNLQAGAPRMLLGYPVKLNPSMPAATTGLKSILFGNLTAGYVVRTVKDVQVLKLVERYGDYLQVGFIGFQRADGLVQDAAAYKALTQA